jgi:hypothetical protein
LNKKTPFYSVGIESGSKLDNVLPEDPELGLRMRGVLRLFLYAFPWRDAQVEGKILT